MGTNMLNRSKLLFYILSPILVVITTHISALTLRSYLGLWVWAAIVAIYWITIAVLSFFWNGIEGVKHLFKPSEKKWMWKAVAVAFGLLTIPVMFIPYHKLLFTGIAIWSSSLILALINPFLEEVYWRGVMLETTAAWPKWVSIVYSSLFFAGFHTAFSWSSTVCRSPMFLINAFAAGILYSVIASRLKSLRWPVVSHFLVNIFGLSAPAFLNMIVLGT